MSNPTRRGFLAASAALPFAQAAPLKTIGVQLYTVRSLFDDPAKIPGTLQALDEIGYREAEAVGASIDKIWPALERTRLKPVSIHLDASLFLDKQNELDAALDSARRRGFRYIVMPYVPANRRGGADAMKQLAATLNKAGEKCRKLGMQLAYHNHAFEFAPAGSGTLLDVLLDNSDKQLVQLEADIFWVAIGGQNPAAFLKKHSGRVPLIHVKDREKGAPQRFAEDVPRSAFKEVGAGDLDLAAILAAAQAAGTKHFFVEQDQTPGDPVASLRQSFSALRSMKM